MAPRSRLLFTLLAGAAGLAGAEAIARWAKPAPLPANSVDGYLMQHCADPLQLVENRPCSVQRIRLRARHPERVVVAVVNEQGFRGAEVEVPKPAGVYRIAALGDSHTFGSGVDEGEDWPAVVGRLLSAGGGRFEVMNCGVPGYESEQVMVMLKKRVLAYQPDLVLYGYFANDTDLNTLAVRPAPPEREGWAALCDGGRPGFLRELRDRSELIEAMLGGLDRYFTRKALVHVQESLYREDFEGWIRTQAAIVRMNELLAERGGRFAMVLLPYLVRVDGKLVSDVGHRSVSRFCRKEGIPCVDLGPIFEDLEVESLVVDPRDRHFGPEAYRIAGETVAKWLTDELGVGAR